MNPSVLKYERENPQRPCRSFADLNGSNQSWKYRGPAPAMKGKRQRFFDGRLEKRLPTSVPVRLGSPIQTQDLERAVTENVSRHGTRVISERSWKPGEEVIVAFRGEFQQKGRVVYCAATSSRRFCLGVKFIVHESTSTDWLLVQRYECPNCGKRYAVADWKRSPKCRQCGTDLRPFGDSTKVQQAEQKVANERHT